MIQLINLKRQAALDRSTILHNINNDIKNANFILGKKNILLEKKISKYLNSKYCLTCSSGTDALLMSLLAIDIKPGDVFLLRSIVIFQLRKLFHYLEQYQYL